MNQQDEFEQKRKSNMKRQTQRERQQMKTELSQKFDRWNKMSDDELMAEAKMRVPELSGVPHRGQLLKLLVMDHLDKLN